MKSHGLVAREGGSLASPWTHTVAAAGSGSPEELHGLVQIPEVILSFQALRSLSKVTSRDGQAVVPWKVMIGLRSPEATAAHGILMKLTNRALKQLILTRLRPATMRRGLLAQRIGQMLAQEGPSSGSASGMEVQECSTVLPCQGIYVGLDVELHLRVC